MITVQELKAKQGIDDALMIASSEKRIDEALIKYDGRTVSVDFSAGNVPRCVLDKLCEMYRAGGWHAVIHTGDQRDPGPWIEFSAPTAGKP
jgi:hypothetical protein